MTITLIIVTGKVQTTVLLYYISILRIFHESCNIIELVVIENVFLTIKEFIKEYIDH